MRPAFLYIMHERDWRQQSFEASENLELDRCLIADMVIEFSEGKFHILKNRFGENDIHVPVPNR